MGASSFVKIFNVVLREQGTIFPHNSGERHSVVGVIVPDDRPFELKDKAQTYGIMDFMHAHLTTVDQLYLTRTFA